MNLFMCMCVYCGNTMDYFYVTYIMFVLLVMAHNAQCMFIIPFHVQFCRSVCDAYMFVCSGAGIHVIYTMTFTNHKQSCSYPLHSIAHILLVNYLFFSFAIGS